MKEIKSLFFDYGGTLDTGGRHWGYVFWDVYHRMIPSINYQAYRNAYVDTERMLGRDCVIRPNTTFKEVLRLKVDSHFSLLNVDKKMIFDDKTLKNHVVEALYDKVIEETKQSRDVIFTLKEQYPIALVSNFYGNLSTVLCEFEMDKLFDLVVESAMVGIRKPDEAIYRYALREMNCHPAEAVVIGDSIKNDVIPAHSLGCKTVWIKGKSWNENEENTAIAGYEIESLRDLLKISL